jgi:excisionase family DNA binding protein
MNDELLTVSQAAEDLRASTQTIRNWIRAERLAAVRIGNRFLVPRAEVQRLLGEPRAAALGESPWDFDLSEPAQRLPRATGRLSDADPSRGMLGG